MQKLVDVLNLKKNEQNPSCFPAVKHGDSFRKLKKALIWMSSILEILWYVVFITQRSEEQRLQNLV
jgi:ABC-type transport system involved in Fe-S cluster assembly fused permease/ATPase subunit